MSIEVGDSVAVVTGGASGLGEATGRRLLEAGALVVLVDRDADRGAALAAELGSRVRFLAADVTSPEAVAAAVEAAEELGPVRVGVTCAGVVHGERSVARDGTIADLEAFRRVVEVNLVGTYNVVCQVAAAIARSAPGEDGERGVLVTTSSLAAFEGQVGQAAYSSSKGGVASLTLPMARELATAGIRVCSIAPGPMDTPMLASLSDRTRDGLVEAVVFPKRLAHPDEFAALVLHIVTNSYLNGETIRLDAGLRTPAR